MSQTQTICSLNDRFRQGDMNIQGKILITSGLNHLLAEQDREASELLKKVQDYSDFDEDNDPHGEHDFGAFLFLGEKCFWKIDYYSPDLKWCAEDPSDAKNTMRVLTIMLAQEY